MGGRVLAWSMHVFEMVSIQSIRDGQPTSAQQNFIWHSSILRWNHCNILILRKHHLEGLHEILFSMNELVHSDPLDSLNLLSRKHWIAKDHVKSVFFVGIASGHCRVNNLNHQPDSLAQCKQDACADTQDGTIETDVFFFFWSGWTGTLILVALITWEVSLCPVQLPLYQAVQWILHWLIDVFPGVLSTRLLD